MASPLASDELGRLLDQHGPALRLYATGWTTAPDDCVQEALIELAGTIPPPTLPVAWLYRVVRRRAHNHYRSELRRAKREMVAATMPTACRSNQTNLEAIDLLDQLAPDARELVVLRIWGGRTFAEIAEITKRSTSSLHRDYQLALDRLRNLLSPEVEVTHASQTSK